MYRNHTIAVVIPAYNEEGFVGDVITDLPAYTDRAYVIDDGSTDGTWAEIRHYATEQNRGHDGAFDELVVGIRHDENRGVGGAIKTGYQQALADEVDITAVLGGDDQMNPDVLSRYLDPIVEGRAEYTKGNRFVSPDDWQAMPRFRLLGNVVLSYLTKIASGYWQSMDSQNGYTAISRQALERTDIDEMYEYYGYCNDLLIRLNEADVPIADVQRSSAYAYSEGWKSHINYAEYIPRVSTMLLGGFVRRLRRKYVLTGYNPLVIFYVLGASVLAASLVGLVRSLFGNSGEEAGSWVLSATLGTLTLVAATEYDRTDNRHLETVVEATSSVPEGEAVDRTDSLKTVIDDTSANQPRSDRQSAGAENSDTPAEPMPGDGVGRQEQ